MDVDDGSASLQLLHHRIEGGIAEPAIAIARHEHDPVRVELIESVFDLAQSAFDVGKGECGEEAKPFRMSLLHLCGVQAGFSRQASALRYIAEPDAWR